jgi:hypothetical protein
MVVHKVNDIFSGSVKKYFRNYIVNMFVKVVWKEDHKISCQVYFFSFLYYLILKYYQGSWKRILVFLFIYLML